MKTSPTVTCSCGQTITVETTRTRLPKDDQRTRCDSVLWFVEPLGNFAGRLILSRPKYTLFRVAAAAAVLLLASCGGNSSPASSATTALSTLVTGLTAPLDLQQPDDGSGRLFIVEQGGTIRIVKNGSLLATPFLDISSKVHMEGESGLLGMTFHPDYVHNPRFFVNYVRQLADGTLQTVIAEFQASLTNPDLADSGSERDLLFVPQPFSNHKGGQLAFGPEGDLYFGLGDGGGAGDPFGNGQNTHTLLGKMLRIDVNSPPSPGLQYAIPSDNPFVNGGGSPEIFAYGLRNPWRFSFDRPSGRLFVGDVGQDKYEEVDVVQKGGNYGWNIMEGMHCFSPPTGCDETGLLLPIAEYDHSIGQAIIGGYVYHGSAIPKLQGTYVFADLTGKVFALNQNATGTWNRSLLLSPATNISSLGQDQEGELYVIEISNGTVMKLVAQ